MERTNEKVKAVDRPSDEIIRIEQRHELKDVDHTGDNYLGHYASIEAFAQAFIDENGLRDRVEPSWLRSYVRFDLDRLGRDLVCGLVVMKDRNGGVYIFDPTA